MTYARARLWLGVTGVGSVVAIVTAAILLDLSQALLQQEGSFNLGAPLQLVCLTGLFLLWLMPMDFLGGYYLPARFQKSQQSFNSWLRSYSVAAVSQALLFVLFGCLILLFSQQWGVVGGIAAVSLGIFACFTVRDRMVLARRVTGDASATKVLEATNLIQTWQIFVPRTVVVEHTDVGFTGGIVGVGKNAKIVIPESWLSFSRPKLAAAIARRAVAINSGSYTRGLLLACAWNVGGFVLCSFMPEAGLSSVAGLVTTVCGFTLWSFFGLLTLPTLSRNASLRIDQDLLQQGIPPELISDTAFALDQMQDNEPERSPLIEAIFHPVPSVKSRNSSDPIQGLAAWNVARTTLFFSWACLGFLSRSVHCNVGRPELWAMLPSD